MTGLRSTFPTRLRPRRGGSWFVSFAVCSFLLFGLATCSRPRQDQAPPAIETSEDLFDALTSAGAEVRASPAGAEPTLRVPALPLMVGGEEVLVYEYATPEDRQAVSASISLDAATIDGTAVEWPVTPTVWVSGRLIVVYPGQDGGTILLLDGLLGDPILVQSPVVDEPYPPAVAAAIEALSQRLGSDPTSIQVTGFEPVEWPDACLGLPEEGEQCAQAVTPGWRIRLTAGDRAYEAHTDLLGLRVRLK